MNLDCKFGNFSVTNSLFSLLPILQKAGDRKSPGDNWKVITRGERRGRF